MAERTRQFFVTHIGTVTVNNFGAVSFDANIPERRFDPHIPAKVVAADYTIAEINKGVREAVRAFKAEGVWRVEEESTLPAGRGDTQKASAE